MAIYFSLSAKSDLKGLCEIMIRYKSGVYSARAKSGLYSLSGWFEFVIGNNLETPYKGKKIFTNEMKETQAYHEKQKTRLSEINEGISEALKNPELNRSNSDWLKLIIDKFNFPEKYAPKAEKPKDVTVFQFIDKFIKDTPNRKEKSTGRPLTHKNAQQYKATERRLIEYAKSSKKKGL